LIRVKPWMQFFGVLPLAASRESDDTHEAL
jgi:hypothetical protein